MNLRVNVFAGSVITANSPFRKRLLDLMRDRPLCPSMSGRPMGATVRSGPTVAVEPISQARPAGQPVPGITQPAVVEDGGQRVVVIAPQVDFDLGDFVPGGVWQREQIDLLATDDPGLGFGPGVGKSGLQRTDDLCPLCREVGLAREHDISATR